MLAWESLHDVQQPLPCCSRCDAGPCFVWNLDIWVSLGMLDAVLMWQCQVRGYLLHTTRWQSRQGQGAVQRKCFTGGVVLVQVVACRAPVLYKEFKIVCKEAGVVMMMVN